MYIVQYVQYVQLFPWPKIKCMYKKQNATWQLISSLHKRKKNQFFFILPIHKLGSVAKTAQLLVQVL